jgi:hypothetical protein
VTSSKLAVSCAHSVANSSRVHIHLREVTFQDCVKRMGLHLP